VGESDSYALNIERCVTFTKGFINAELMKLKIEQQAPVKQGRQKKCGYSPLLA
jgi:hypothetical protein